MVTGQPLFEAGTQSTSVAVMAPVSGFLHIVVPEGHSAPVGESVAYIAANRRDLLVLHIGAGEISLH